MHCHHGQEPSNFQSPLENLCAAKFSAAVIVSPELQVPDHIWDTHHHALNTASTSPSHELHAWHHLFLSKGKSQRTTVWIVNHQCCRLQNIFITLIVHAIASVIKVKTQNRNFTITDSCWICFTSLQFSFQTHTSFTPCSIWGMR